VQVEIELAQRIPRQVELARRRDGLQIRHE
jgi:hypothetical protein